MEGLDEKDDAIIVADKKSNDKITLKPYNSNDKYHSCVVLYPPSMPNMIYEVHHYL